MSNDPMHLHYDALNPKFDSFAEQLADRYRRKWEADMNATERAANAYGGTFVRGEAPDFKAQAEQAMRMELDRLAFERAVERMGLWT